MKVVWIVLMALLGGDALGQSMEILGRVVNQRGVGISNAVVTVRAVTRGTGTRYGVNEDVDREARTDRAGNFRIRGTNEFISATVTVEAPGFAKGVFSQLATGETRHELKMSEGVSVIGTVNKNGVPVAGVKVGLSDTERGSEIFLLNVTAETDAKGRFRFAHIPAKRDYFFHGVMSSLLEHGAINSRRISTSTNETVLNVGTVEIEPAFSIEGLIRPAEKNVKVTLGRDGPRDTQKVETDENGAFRFRAVPKEVVSLAATIPGKRLTMQNGSLFPPNPTQLLGRIYTNVAGLVLEFEPGETLEPLNVNPFASREEPLRGAEHSQPVPGGFKVSGTVLDAIENKPLTNFWVIEGRGSSRREWFLTRVQAQTNGMFTVYFAERSEPAALQFWADDHLPEVRTGFSGDVTNVIVSLARGVTAEGKVLRPDGSPAVGAKVYLGAQQPIHLQGPPFELYNDYQTRRAVVDKEGWFEFAPRFGDSYLAVVDDSGFAEVDLQKPRGSRDIQLQKWGRVEGSLMVETNAAANEVVYLTSMASPYEWYPRELPPISLSMRTRTDTNGNFVFEKVPPMLLEVAHSPQMRETAPEPIDRTQTRRIAVKPGETARVKLGGEGRTLFGQVSLEGLTKPQKWSLANSWIESAPDTNAPSNAALTNLLQKLAASNATNSTASSREKNAADYERERQTYAKATRDFYGTDRGKAALMASRRFAVHSGEDGLFRIDDVPPGKYVAHWMIVAELDSATPSPIYAGRMPLMVSETVVDVPAGTGPVDLGTIRLKRPPGK